MKTFISILIFIGATTAHAQYQTTFVHNDNIYGNYAPPQPVATPMPPPDMSKYGGFQPQVRCYPTYGGGVVCQ